MEELYPFKEAEQYVNLLQENITRMASNSANCKNWLMGIIGGVLAVSFAEKGIDYLPYMLTLLICATAIFFFLDCFYLGIEHEMKDAEKEFIQACKDCKKEHPSEEEKARPMKLFMTFTNKEPKDEANMGSEEGIKKRVKKWFYKRMGQLWNAIKALDSWSTTPFYLTILGFLIALKCAITHCSCCCCCH